ncbi:Spore germination protein [Sulfobacillus thermosulfidooxidans DSM 9293]|uniref:Spore germination protein n=1 Tax=Sulfobacillus thermosulfidooxidans (strain DSM 9293 / VKM B-1269 / AT-1) TaxID=929705 RepID=A0A1W1WGF4_SULTA|nr:GerAB/ArcD/ProY family transporter [Sulfobacillus thermosulfidooxidans]SMC04803.1 Spore germination protein [Sulfobacillus thermosulfidooxidans DSM 9293]
MSIVTGAIFIWPQAILLLAGDDTPWAILASIAMAVVMSSLALIWMNITPSGILADRMRHTWHGFAWPILFIHITLCLILDATMLALFAQMLSAVFYPLTPLWAMKLMIAAESAWFASRSFHVLARNIQFWFPILMLLLFLLITIEWTNVHCWWALRPSTHIVVHPLLQAILSTWFLWKQNEVSVTVAHFVRSPTQMLIRKLTLGAILFQGIVISLIYVITVGSIGPYAVLRLRWPLVYVLSNQSSHTFYLSRPGLIILLIWTGAIVFYLAAHLFCMGVNLSKLFTKSYNLTPIAVWVFTILEIVITFFIPTPTTATHLLLDFFNPVDLSVSVIVLVTSILIRLIANALHAKQHPA